MEAELRRFAEERGLKLGAIAQPLRAALTGSLASPGLFEVMEVLGREESLARIENAARAGEADRKMPAMQLASRTRDIALQNLNGV